MRLLIGIPNFDGFKTEFVNGLIPLVAYTMRRRPDLELLYHCDTRTYRDYARNGICETAIGEGADYLLFIDDDMIAPRDAALRLLAHDKAVVSGLYFQRRIPTSPVMYDREGEQYRPIKDWKPNELLEVDGVGLGFCMVRRDALERVMTDEPFSRSGHKGEDLQFCRTVEEAGIPIYVDTGLIVGHLWEAHREIGLADYEAARRGDVE